jgi:hypothetical protein
MLWFTAEDYLLPERASGRVTALWMYIYYRLPYELFFCTKYLTSIRALTAVIWRIINKSKQY